MEILQGLLLGVVAAAGATLFPGMQNMAGVSVALRAGRRVGYRFAAGLALAFTAQATLAILFAGYFTTHPGVIDVLRQWSVPVFTLLAAYFLTKGYRIRASDELPEDRPYHGNPIAGGILLALMNLLVVPYFFALGGWLLADGYLAVSIMARLAFVFGAGAGALLIYWAYARMADWVHRRATFLTRNINFVMGGLLLVVALVQGYRIYA